MINDPVNMVDVNGEWGVPPWLLYGMAAFGTNVAIQYFENRGDIDWFEAGLHGLFGATVGKFAGDLWSPSTVKVLEASKEGIHIAQGIIGAGFGYIVGGLQSLLHDVYEGNGRGGDILMAGIGMITGFTTAMIISKNTEGISKGMYLAMGSLMEFTLYGLNYLRKKGGLR